MNLGRTAQVMAVIVYVCLIGVMLWFMSLDTLAQANWMYPATALALITGAAVVVYCVRLYRRLDELAQRVHLVALAVAFVGTLLIVFIWAVLDLFGVVGEMWLLRRLAGASSASLLGFSALGVMLALYLVGWVWGRSLYR